jgi:ribonuclease P/MRP protein subunit RPP20
METKFDTFSVGSICSFSVTDFTKRCTNSFIRMWQHQLKKSVNRSHFMHRRHKRTPQKSPIKETDIYVSKKTIVPVQLKRIHELLKIHPTVTIHGLGIAMATAVSVALRFKKEEPRIEWEITTSTVTLVDDLEPIELDDEPTTSTRNNSAIHIQLSFKK